MSSILDALEKSERERNQTSVPQYHDMQPPEESGFRWKWFLVAGVLLVLALLIFSAIRWMPAIEFGNESAVETNTGEVLNYSQLSDLEKSAVPGARINVVSVSDDPKRSFVMLGEKMYRENDTVAQDVTLETIRKDHIVFNKNGSRIRRDLEQ